MYPSGYNQKTVKLGMPIKHNMVEVQINSYHVKALLDTGAEITCICEFVLVITKMKFQCHNTTNVKNMHPWYNKVNIYNGTLKCVAYSVCFQKVTSSVYLRNGFL